MKLLESGEYFRRLIRSSSILIHTSLPFILPTGIYFLPEITVIQNQPKTWRIRLLIEAHSFHRQILLLNSIVELANHLKDK